MPTTQGTRTIAASRQELWDVLGDPHHLPRWWPRVTRVEAVEDGAFTQVLMSSKGKIVRADFTLVDSVVEQRIVWAQRIEGTPFERILQSAETEISLADADADADADAEEEAHGDNLDGGLVAGTKVTIELRQTLRNARLGSWAGPPKRARRSRVPRLPRFGGFLVRRAADSTIEEALDGLERILGGSA
jgi:uncharacterized protein YndB with AHSA1/START domain